MIEWADRFFEDIGQPRLKNRSRALDTSIAKALHHLDFGVPLHSGANPPFINSLPAITLLRGQRSQLPSGRAVAKAICQDLLTHDEMMSGHAPAVREVLERLKWTDDAPLWFYVLHEGAIKGQKRWLGPVGSHIVGRTIVGLLKADSDSILTAGQGWKPPVWGANGWRANTMGKMVGLAIGALDPSLPRPLDRAESRGSRLPSALTSSDGGPSSSQQRISVICKIGLSYPRRPDRVVTSQTIIDLRRVILFRTQSVYCPLIQRHCVQPSCWTLSICRSGPTISWL